MGNPIPKGKEKVPNEFLYPIGDKIKLRTPRLSKKIDTIDNILRRRSIRKFSTLNLAQISKVLWLSSKVITSEVQNNGYIITYRPAPSAGGRHPIDIIISLPNNIARQLYFYNPFDHSLNKLLLDKKLVNSFIDHIDDIVSIKNATIIWFVAHPDRTKSKYRNAESLIWRDAGALIYCLQLACTAFRINSCAVGSLGEPFISTMLSNCGQVVGVGGVLIG